MKRSKRKLLPIVVEALDDAERLEKEIGPLLTEFEKIMASKVGRRLSHLQAKLDELRPKYNRALHVAGWGMYCDTRGKK